MMKRANFSADALSVNSRNPELIFSSVRNDAEKTPR
jgi:hypothetical protein